MIGRWVALGALAAAIGCASEGGIAGPRVAGGGEMGTGAGNPSETRDERRHLLERVDDAAVVQVYADGFETLDRRTKTLVWHLYQAAIAGRDIYYDQKHRHGLALRNLLESTLVALGTVGPEWEHAAAGLAGEGIDAATMAEIRRYTKLYWLHSGPYHSLTSRKFTLQCAPAAFAAAVKAAARRGAGLPLEEGESVDAMLARFQPLLFDPSFEPMCTNKSPAGGEDILLASANNLHHGVSMKDLEGFEERYGLNSRLVKRADGTLVEEVYRAGFDHVVPPGRYAETITRVIGHLEDAIPFATPRMARALGALIQWYRTGEQDDFRDYCVAWVADDDSPVDTVNGFIEVYVDARGVKGSWEGIVSIDDPEKMRQIRAFAENAQWFEDRMPIAPEYRKPQVKGISAKAIQVVIETGDSGPITPIGINLPNPQDIREKYGSKSVSLGNVVEAYEKSAPAASRREFCFDEAEFERSQRWKSLCDALTTNLHEVIGHASGRAAPWLEGDPARHIREHYSALEEARSDLVALCFIGDPKLKELGLVDDPRGVQLTEYEGYTRNALTQLNRVKEGDQLEEDHMRNRQMIVHWLMAHTKAIEVARLEDIHDPDGTKTYYRVVDQDEWHRGACALLKEVQRMKSEGDYAAAAKLFQDHGIKFDPKLRDEVVARFERQKLPSYSGFVFPKLTARIGADGAIEDVAISYPCDLEAQMLEWSGRGAASPAPAGAATGAR